MRSLVLFVVGSSLFGAVSLGIGYWIWADDALVQGGTAFGLAFVPAASTLAWVVFSYRTAPDMKLLASLGATGFRMAIALGGGYFLTISQPLLFDGAFWSWLALFYLVMLAFEITLLVRDEPKLNESPQG